MTEEVENQCMICYEDVKKKCDFFGIIDCCDHIHCFKCISQWYNHWKTQLLPITCTCCRKEFKWVTMSLIPMKSCSPELKKKFMRFSRERRFELSDWGRRMKRDGMTVEQCTFNCGFAEIMEDATLMCPHGSYDWERYDADQRQIQVVRRSGLKNQQESENDDEYMQYLLDSLKTLGRQVRYGNGGRCELNTEIEKTRNEIKQHMKEQQRKRLERRRTAAQ